MGDARVGKVRVGDNKCMTGKAVGIGSLEQHGGRMAITEVLAVLRIGEEAQLTRPSFLKGCQAGDFQLRGATQGSPEELGQLTEFHSHSHTQRD
ncbi:hypothetical protein D3C80_1831160 [compost metagenome]